MNNNLDDSKWLFSDPDSFLSHNPYEVKGHHFRCRMYSSGFFELKKDGNFEYWHLDLSKIPIESKIEYYEIEVYKVVYDFLNGYSTELEGLDDLHYNFKMLIRHMMTRINNKHCT